MPEEEKRYKFSELSKEAQKKAIEDWRDAGHAFDDSDAHFLTEQFERDLEEKGFSGSRKQWVYWSLGYCQGDGVCFEGSVDPEVLFKEKAFRKFKDLKDSISIHVSVPDSRYCHWNSMHVEVTDDLRYETFLNEDDVRQIRDWEWKESQLLREWNDEVRRVQQERYAPVRAWEDIMRERTGVLDWMPDKPEPLDIPLPPRPELPLSSRLKRVKARAEQKVKDLGALLPELEEAVSDWVKDLSRSLEKMGYEEIEYRQSDEAIAEFFENNEYEFDEEGEIL